MAGKIAGQFCNYGFWPTFSFFLDPAAGCQCVATAIGTGRSPPSGLKIRG